MGAHVNHNRTHEKLFMLKRKQEVSCANSMKKGLKIDKNKQKKQSQGSPFSKKFGVHATITTKKKSEGTVHNIKQEVCHFEFETDLLGWISQQRV